MSYRVNLAELSKPPSASAGGDAWSRRIERDWGKMPLAMRLAFLVSFSGWRVLPLLGYALSAIVPLLLLGAIHGSYLAGGSGLINRDYLLLAGCIFFLSAFLVLVLPRLINFLVVSWYRAIRYKFK